MSPLLLESCATVALLPSASTVRYMLVELVISVASPFGSVTETTVVAVLGSV
jgi:hypothetical protein